MNKGGIFRIVKNPDNPYVMVDKGFVNNPNLSWKAKGILLYLLSKPDDWQVYEGDLVKRATDGRDSVRAGVRELEKYGYIIRIKERDEAGKITGMAYNVYELPSIDGLSGAGKPNDGFSPTTNNDLELCNESTNTSMSSASNNSESKIPHKEIIDLLNECSGKDFKHSTKATQEHINARWREGFTIEDFEKVIRHKCTQWKDDPKMNPYLRPSTLFSPKFESYLNEKTISGNKTSNGGPRVVHR